jgi:hypothetical protein
MTSSQFRKWIYKHYHRKQSVQFLRDFNATCQVIGAPRISWKAMSKWMYDSTREPPARWGSVEFEELLRLILERRRDPGATTRLYTINLPVTEQQERTIEQRAWHSGCAPEEWLKMMLEAAIDGGSPRG